MVGVLSRCREKCLNINFSKLKWGLIYFILVTLIVQLQGIYNMDELWKYHISLAIDSGKALYRDINLLNTPFVYLLASIFLKIDNSIFVFRFAAILLWTLMFIEFHKIARFFNKDNMQIFSVNVFILLFCCYNKCVYLCYNQMILLISLFIIHLLLRGSINKSKAFLIGCLSFLAVFSKYSTGIIICIAAFFAIIVMEKKIGKKMFVNIGCFLGSFFLHLIVCICLFFYNDIFDSFIDMTIGGMSGFKNNAQTPIDYIKECYAIDILILTVLVLILIFTVVTIIRNKVINKERIMIFLFAAANMMTAYPIFEEAHYYQFFYLIMLLFLSLNIKLKFRIDYIVTGVSIILMTYLQLFEMQDASLKRIPVYGRVFIAEANYEELQLVNNYVEDAQKDVYIIDVFAARYNIALNRYIKYEANFLNGNLGGKTAAEACQSIVGNEEAIILIKDKKEQYNSQFPLDVYEYIEENYIRIGKISSFLIYENK